MQRVFLPCLLLLSLLTTCIEVDMSVPGFPNIAHDFGVREGIIQLTITYNFLGFCLSALFYGPLSESFGRRKVMLAGNALMVVGAIGCYYAPSINLLILSRFIQGLGASTAVVLVFAMIADLYESSKGMKLIGIANTFLSTSMAFAPLIGGFVNETIGWRGNYGVVAALSVFTFLLQCFFLPESKKSFDKFSISKIIADYKMLFNSGAFVSTALIPSLLFASYMSYIAASAFLYISSYGLSTASFVLHQACIIGAFALMSVFAQNITQTLGTQRTTTVSFMLCCLSSAMLLGFGYIGFSSPLITTVSLVLFSIGFAVCYPIIFSSSLSIFPEMYGTASSAIMSLRALLVSGFTSVSCYLYDGSLMSVAIPFAIGIFISVALLNKTSIYKPLPQ